MNCKLLNYFGNKYIHNSEKKISNLGNIFDGAKQGLGQIAGDAQAEKIKRIVIFTIVIIVIILLILLWTKIKAKAAGKSAGKAAAKAAVKVAKKEEDRTGSTHMDLF